jgi:hypothetical protein
MRIVRIPLQKPTGEWEWLQSEEYEATAREMLQQLQLMPSAA